MSALHLNRLKNYHAFPGPVVLVIMDGVGLGKRDESDGVFMAYTPVLDELFEEPLFAKLRAHGKAVGLPTDEDMGNSAVGHNVLGAGRVFAQGARLVNDAITTELALCPFHLDRRGLRVLQSSQERITAGA